MEYTHSPVYPASQQLMEEVHLAFPVVNEEPSQLLMRTTKITYSEQQKKLILL